MIRVTDVQGKNTFYDEGVSVTTSKGELWVRDDNDRIIAGHAENQWIRWAVVKNRD